MIAQMVSDPMHSMGQHVGEAHNSCHTRHALFLRISKLLS